VFPLCPEKNTIYGGMNMKKKVIFSLIGLLVVTVSALPAHRIAVVQEILRPNGMIIGNERIYIYEEYSLYIYSLKDLNLIKKFGKEGEGPQEFKISPFGPPMDVYTYDNKLFITSNNKLSCFTRDGQFIKEFRIPIYLVYRPLLDVFVSTGRAAIENDQTVLTINLSNAKLEKIKELYRSDTTVGPSAYLLFPINPLEFPVYENRIYIPAIKEGFIIDVFDAKGEKMYRIKKEDQPIEVSLEYKNKTLDWFKTNPTFKQYWDFFKKRISFKTHYPAIQHIEVTDNRIYAFTYKKQKGDTECIILDLKGNEEKRVFLPFSTNYGFDLDSLSAIHNRAFYMLVENEDDEVWELHKQEIK
jgi:hypothetical protein